ncbi:hypothetical protein HAX54_046604 [Datura stramonium]|uniref:Uncharacterized protein n=1 Tax=Datura stramonium TaxID=4076 RepID=A0ABS8STB0_DATST|nr:hypothetical protein [Datura stramonium]
MMEDLNLKQSVRGMTIDMHFASQHLCCASAMQGELREDYLGLALHRRAASLHLRNTGANTSKQNVL